MKNALLALAEELNAKRQPESRGAVSFTEIRAPAHALRKAKRDHLQTFANIEKPSPSPARHGVRHGDACQAHNRKIDLSISTS